MATANNVQAWSSTAASNNTADSTITSSDSQAPDTVDNDIRNIMAGVRNFAKDTGGSLVAGGSANALTVTTKQALSSGHLADGLTLQIEALSDNTSATVTFAPDGLTAGNVKRADGSALAIGSIKAGMRLILCYDTGASEWRCANIPPLSVISGGGTSVGTVLLTSGSASGATLDLVLTTYTAYRGLRFVLAGMRPATDDVNLLMRFSTDGGSTYITTSNYHYVSVIIGEGGTPAGAADAASSAVVLNGPPASNNIGNAATEGINTIVDMLNQTSTALFTRVKIASTFMNSAATSAIVNVDASGCYAVAQDTDAVRFLFSSGNITSGTYAVYGLL